MERTMTEQAKRSMFTADGVAAPLRHAVFRRIWLASLLSNLGLLIQAVGAAWAMTQMTSSADMVALVQTALMLPVMLISMPAGAIADMYDRRIVALVSLTIALAGATALSVLAWLGLVTPHILLALCFVVGSGMALFGPAWQSSVSEQVPAETLPSAVALNGISYNIARSFGPAIGGIVVATAGAVAAFAANAVLYVPLLVVLFLWRRTSEPSRLPRERLNRAIVSGVRYIANSPAIKIVLTRTFVTGVIGGSVSALMPLVARDLLHGGAQTYGIMLGAFGMGAVIRAVSITVARNRIGGEAAGGARPLAWRRAALRHHARRLRHGWGDRRPEHRRSAQPDERRGRGARLRAVDGGRDRGCGAEPRAGTDRHRAGDCRRGVDAVGGAVQHRRAALGAALGCGPLAGGVPGRDRGRHRDRQLGLGTPDRCGWRRNCTAGFRRPDVCVSAARTMAWNAAGRRPQRGCGGAGRSRGATVADRAQRAFGGRDRIPRCPGQRPRLPQCDAGGAAEPPAQRRLWLVGRARHRRSRIVDRALSLPDLARLFASAQSLDAIGARAAPAGDRFSSRTRSGAGATHAGTPVRIGALEGRYARPCRERGIAGGDGCGE